MTPVVPAPEPEKGVKILTPEEMAHRMKLPVTVIKKMLAPNGRSALKFDDRDVDRRFGRKNVRLYFSEPNASGFARPRVVKRKGAQA
jgi:hypothetical protein